jgi:hypothetical protein
MCLSSYGGEISLASNKMTGLYMGNCRIAQVLCKAIHFDAAFTRNFNHDA